MDFFESRNKKSVNVQAYLQASSIFKPQCQYSFP